MVKAQELRRDVANTEQTELFGTPGPDLIDVDVAGDHRLFGFAGDDTLRGGGSCDTLRGGDGDDWLAGQGGADLLLGNAGDDRLFGRAGDDTLLGGAGSDRLDGGNGVNTVSYFGSTGGVFVDLEGQTALDDQGGWDMLLNFRHITGGTGDDTLLGDANANRIQALGGADTVFGYGGDDTLRGSEGADALRGGPGDDVLVGGTGEDDLRGQAGSDTIRGGGQDDVIFGGDGADVLIGGDGQDTLHGGAGADRFVFAAASDLAGAGRNADLISDFEPGLDRIDLRPITGGAGAFIGSSGFSGAGVPELRVIYNANGNALLQLDLDGDGFDDKALVLQDVTGLSAGDFLL